MDGYEIRGWSQTRRGEDIWPGTKPMSDGTAEAKPLACVKPIRSLAETINASSRLFSQLSLFAIFPRSLNKKITIDVKDVEIDLTEIFLPEISISTRHFTYRVEIDSLPNEVDLALE